MSAPKGIRQLFLCEKNTLMNSSPPNRYTPGLMTGAKFRYEDIGVEEIRGAELPDKVKHEIEFKSYQTTFQDLNVFHLVYGRQGGCDLQVVSEKQSASTYGGVYNFTGNQRFMGFNYEWLISGKDRSCKGILRRAIDYEAHLALLQDAMVATPKDLHALSMGHKGVDVSKYRNPGFGKLESPIGSTLVNGYQIVDRKFSMKSVSNDLEEDLFDWQYIEVTFEITTNKSLSWELIDYFSRARNAAIEMEEKLKNGIVEKYSFGEGVLWRKNMFDLDDKQRNVKFVFKRNINFEDFLINSGTQTLSVNETV